jgi:methyl-accepting chemotaxis protein
LAERTKGLGVTNLKRRKRYLIDRTMQLSFLRFVVLCVLMVVVVINCYSTDSVVLAMTSPSGLEEASMDYNLAHSLRETLSARDKELLIYVMLSIVVIILGASFFAITFSYRIAEPAFRIRRALKQVKEGDYSVRVQLRKGDQLKGLADDLNQLIAKLETKGNSH